LSFRLSRRSLDRLQGVHPDLVRVVQRAIRITPIDFVVLEGLRTEARQRELVAAGASRTMRSRHLTGHAVDIAPWVGTVRWDWPLFDQLAPAIKQAASEEGVPVTWGGDWKWRDGPHWELKRSRYPAP
jgi:peptidoglycan L-alanyl-D-glutamate endopeptidase CwlK